jgi:hypothetical protein
MQMQLDSKLGRDGDRLCLQSIRLLGDDKAQIDDAVLKASTFYKKFLIKCFLNNITLHILVGHVGSKRLQLLIIFEIFHFYCFHRYTALIMVISTGTSVCTSSTTSN